MFALVLAGATLVLNSTAAFGGVEEPGAAANAPAGAKLLAAVSLVSWVAVIVLGRYMPLFEETLRK
jgi:hypothetical protein